MQKIADTKEKTNFLLACQEILDLGKCENITHYAGLRDYLVHDVIVVTANSEVHCRAIAERIQTSLKEADIFFLSSLKNIHPKLTPSHKWVVIDCEEFSTMIHLMTESERSYYDIDSLLEKICKSKFVFESKKSDKIVKTDSSFDNLDDSIEISQDYFDLEDDEGTSFNANSLKKTTKTSDRKQFSNKLSTTVKQEPEKKATDAKKKTPVKKATTKAKSAVKKPSKAKVESIKKEDIKPKKTVVKKITKAVVMKAIVKTSVPKKATKATAKTTTSKVADKKVAKTTTVKAVKAKPAKEVVKSAKATKVKAETPIKKPTKAKASGKKTEKTASEMVNKTRKAIR